VEGLPAIAGGVVLGDDLSPMFFRGNPNLCCRHYPFGLRPPPLLQEEELNRIVVLISGNDIIIKIFPAKIATNQ